MFHSNSNIILTCVMCLWPGLVVDTRYNTKINKYLELSVAMRNLWCLEKISILPLIISATGIVPQSLFKNFGLREHIGG
jgi:hypothetical protein